MLLLETKSNHGHGSLKGIRNNLTKIEVHHGLLKEVVKDLKHMKLLGLERLEWTD